MIKKALASSCGARVSYLGDAFTVLLVEGVLGAGAGLSFLQACANIMAHNAIVAIILLDLIGFLWIWLIQWFGKQI
jgi:hypothetical protein